MSLSVVVPVHAGGADWLPRILARLAEVPGLEAICAGDAPAPGGARFVPELVHNRSGIGSSFELMDINKDGTPDIATAGAYGAYVFLSKPTARPAPAAKK